MNNKGKSALSNLILLVIVAYGGFVAVKLISAGLTRGQLRGEVVDMIGLMIFQIELFIILMEIINAQCHGFRAGMVDYVY